MVDNLHDDELIQDADTAYNTGTASVELGSTEVPEDVIRANAKWKIEEAERRLQLEEEKVRRRLEIPWHQIEGISDELIKAKIMSEIDLANRKMRLEELKTDHELALADKIQALKEMETLKLNSMMTSQEEQHWLRKYWRPAAGWTYLFICVFDFVVAPVLFAVLPVFTKTEIPPWNSLTISNGGLMHISFGAILGVAAWTRGQSDLMKTKMVTTKLSSE